VQSYVLTLIDVGVWNQNCELRKYLSIDDPSLLKSNDAQSMNEVTYGLKMWLSAFKHFGVRTTMMFHRGGACLVKMGHIDDYHADTFFGAVMSTYNAIKADPKLLHDNRRYAAQVKEI
jgi:hypothetical protein